VLSIVFYVVGSLAAGAGAAEVFTGHQAGMAALIGGGLPFSRPDLSSTISTGPLSTFRTSIGIWLQDREP